MSPLFRSRFHQASEGSEVSLHQLSVYTPRGPDPKRTPASNFGGVPWINGRHQQRETAGSQISGHADVMGKANFLEMLMRTLSTQGTRWCSCSGGAEQSPTLLRRQVPENWRKNCCSCVDVTRFVPVIACNDRISFHVLPCLLSLFLLLLLLLLLCVCVCVCVCVCGCGCGCLCVYGCVCMCELSQ